MAAEFDGKSITEQNLSEWKHGGYRDWLGKQQAFEIAERLREDAMEWSAEGRAPLTDTLAFWLVARYALATRRVAETGGREGWRLLREMCGDVVELRKGDHSAERLRIDRQRLELEKARSEEDIRQKLPELVKKFGINGGTLSEEERAQRTREIFKGPSDRNRNGGLSRETLAEIESAAKLM